MKAKTNEQKVLNLFEGSGAIIEYLNPDNAPYTPLVEIPAHLNPYRKNGVRIFAKLMSTLPLANIKSLPAYNMLLHQKENGSLPDTLIENSSGNTVFSLAVIARLMGISNTKAVVSNEVSLGKLNLLRFLGAEVIVNEEPICPDPSDPTSGIYKAKMWSKENGWFNPGQYDNNANPEAHYKWTGPQIWEQTKGKVSLLSVGLGTTGSAVGIGKLLKEKNKDVEIIGVSRVVNNPIPGVRTKSLLQEISFDWKSILSHQEEVQTVDSFKISMELCRSGLFVGPSSGLALVGLINHLSKQKLSGEEKLAVFICPDSPFPYISEYFQYLDPSNFPKIENEHLLKDTLNNDSLKDYALKTTSTIKELSPNEIFDLLFEENPEKVWRMIERKEKIETKKGFIIIDVRSESEYKDYHLPESIHVPFYNIDTFLQKNKKYFSKNKTLVLICKHGNTSRLVAYKAKELGIKAISLKGGTTEWSAFNLPRVRLDKCIVKFNL